MTNTHAELRGRYEDFLQRERFDYVDRISTAIDDYFQRSRSKSGKASESRATQVGDIVGWGCPRVRISLGELRSDNPRLAQRLRYDPLRHLRALEAACHAISVEERPGYDKEGVKIKVAIAGPVGAQPSSPRSLTSSYLRQLVCVEGVATKISAIKPKVVKSVHYCERTKQFETREYIDSTDPQLGLNALDASGREIPDKLINITTSAYPTKDKDDNRLETEYGLCVYKDYQTVVLQEMPERAPMGQLPRSVDLVLDHDLVDRIKPGDRIQIVGVFKALPIASSGQSSSNGYFKTAILVNNIQLLGRETNNLIFSPTDIREIRSLGKRDDILDILGKSVAPFIHGHDYIKKALVLQLLSGCEKNLKNGTHLRGDINILMVGDPSTAKSQLLRAAMKIAPLAISTTGKGSTGVGLTAAVTTDPDTRERRLEAGAMVLADRGIVCIDEFDKMGEGDRVSIHEAMEQQTVTISKAGLHASLNARCAVLAAANPVYGQYDRKKRIQENIGLPDSLLSRFDLLFVVLDQLDPKSDRRISAHVIRGHRYRSQGQGAFSSRGVGEGDSDDDFDGDGSDDDHGPSSSSRSGPSSIWQRSHHQREDVDHDNDESENDQTPVENILQLDFLRKYLHFSKTRIKPKLTNEARHEIAVRYAEMRSRQDSRTLPITARSLETIIRLSSAHAKARLSPIVEADPDCRVAIEVLGFALYHENNNHNIRDQQTHPEITENRDKIEADHFNIKKRKIHSLETNSSTEEIMRNLKEKIWNELRENDEQIVLEKICSDIDDRKLVNDALGEMEKDGKVMMAEGMVFQI